MKIQLMISLFFSSFFLSLYPAYTENKKTLTSAINDRNQAQVKQLLREETLHYDIENKCWKRDKKTGQEKKPTIDEIRYISKLNQEAVSRHEEATHALSLFKHDNENSKKFHRQKAVVSAASWGFNWFASKKHLEWNSLIPHPSDGIFSFLIQITAIASITHSSYKEISLQEQQMRIEKNVKRSNEIRKLLNEIYSAYREKLDLIP